MDKFKKLETIVSEKFSKSGLRCKFWNKGDHFRLYLYSDALYDTKKCKQTAYINLTNYRLCVITECPSQPDAWCKSQSEEAKSGLEYLEQEVRTIAHELGVIDEQKADEQAKCETCPVVKGYYLEWQEVRIPINRFGKLVTRNRQFIRVWEGKENFAPRGFVALSDAEFEVAKTKVGKMVEPYTTPDFS